MCMKTSPMERTPSAGRQPYFSAGMAVARSTNFLCMMSKSCSDCGFMWYLGGVLSFDCVDCAEEAAPLCGARPDSANVRDALALKSRARAAVDIKSFFISRSPLKADAASLVVRPAEQHTVRNRQSWWRSVRSRDGCTRLRIAPFGQAPIFGSLQ